MGSDSKKIENAQKTIQFSSVNILQLYNHLQIIDYKAFLTSSHFQSFVNTMVSNLSSINSGLN